MCVVGEADSKPKEWGACDGKVDIPAEEDGRNRVGCGTREGEKKKKEEERKRKRWWGRRVSGESTKDGIVEPRAFAGFDSKDASVSGSSRLSRPSEDLVSRLRKQRTKFRQIKNFYTAFSVPPVCVCVRDNMRVCPAYLLSRESVHCCTQRRTCLCPPPSPLSSFFPSVVVIR